MKLGKFVLPCLMAGLLASCITGNQGNTPKTITYDAFIEEAKKEEAKESPYTKAHLAYSVREGTSSDESVEGTIDFVLDEGDWFTESEDRYADYMSEIINTKASEIDDIVSGLKNDFDDVKSKVTNPSSVTENGGYYQLSPMLRAGAEILIQGGTTEITVGEQKVALDVERIGGGVFYTWLDYGLLTEYLSAEYTVFKEDGEVVIDYMDAITCSIAYEK